MIFNSCKDCTRRHVGCHSACSDYLAAKARNDAIKEVKKRHQALEDDILYVIGKRQQRY